MAYNQDIDFIINRLGFKKEMVYQNDSRALEKGKDNYKRVLNIYDLKLNSNDEPFATIVVNTKNRNNKIVIAIGSNQKDPNNKKKKNNFKVKLEPTRLNSLIASDANYLIQFDISNVASYDNFDLKNKDKKDIINGILLSLNQLNNTLKYLNNHQEYYEIILAYGIQGYYLLTTDSDNKGMHKFAKTIMKYGTVIKQFVLPEGKQYNSSNKSGIYKLYPPHASYPAIGTYKIIKKIDDKTLKGYLSINND